MHPSHELIPNDYFRHLRREEIFPDPTRSLELDIGCGDGTFLIEMATHYPQRDFLGVERLSGRVNAICRKAERRGLSNLRVICLESAYTLAWILPDACATRLHLLFPDPWPKKRHSKKRFVQSEILASLRRVLIPSGHFLFKTDHSNYFDDAVSAIEGTSFFQRIDWLDVDEFYPITDFEQLWLDHNRTIQSAQWIAQ